MNFSFSIENLPSVNFTKLSNLPSCAGIYFVLDSNFIIHYIGKSENINKRWKNHHRKDQIGEINARYPVKVFWLTCNIDDLGTAEKYFIDHYKPLLNDTKVELPKIVPSEIILRRLLKKITNKVFAIGCINGNSTTLTKIYIKYDASNYTSTGAAAIIKKFQSENKQSCLKIKRSRYVKEIRGPIYRIGSRDHRLQAKQNRAYNNHWEIFCNGVIIDITPENGINELNFLKEFSIDWRLANVKIQAIPPCKFSIMNEQHKTIMFLLPYLSPLNIENDPIPLFWRDWKE
ncbi:GIY-YIG nuclease family protein [Synechocystis sp. PCC 7338]|uniref:GIY-YIG nuclease family protein n=1 Tax=Synechocystis sp. PCC 7338 TaxID=2732530 RepID=UPI001BAE61E2|nr:GIY-YIG nuclease family protein [Synechocystis sp. PCC 7338]QUS60827.1 GIY-YIG nuclease family protein [Synechocystis sp. PCC 7338]